MNVQFIHFSIKISSGICICYYRAKNRAGKNECDYRPAADN